MNNRGFVISHTHWDRAWYLPFQAYRLRLVRMIDDLLELLESDDSFKCFTLDGQTVLLEDYLEIRPQNRVRLQKLVQASRLFIGPWYTLPDLFIPCGESVIRNLQLGLNIAREFGEPMKIGYLPDPFGHFAQLPQILQGFDISSFIFMRGAGKFIEKTGSIFDWRAPDGSTVLSVYLRDGYLAAGALGHPSPFGRFDGCKPDICAAANRIESSIKLLEPMQKERCYLLPNGCDHMPPQKELPSLLKALNEKNPDLPLIQSSFPEFIEALRSESCPHDQYAGDLLGNLHHPILLSVYSTRMYLKQQNRRAEYFLIKIAEPLLANLGKIVRTADSKPFLDLAWRLLLRNHAHDDICGCSIDEVHDENEVRFAEIISIARTLITEALESLVLTGITATDNTDRKSPASNVFIFNPHPFSVRTRISCTFMIPNPGGEFSEPTRQSGITAISGSGRTLPVSVDASEAMVARSAYLETTWGRRYQVTVPLEMPALGYQIVRFSENGEMNPVNPVNPAADVPMIDTENILLEATLRQLSLSDRKSGQRFAEVLCFEYEDDAGDTYSFGPVAGRQPQHATIQDAAWSPKKGGLLAITYRLASEMPSDSKPSHREIPVEIKVEVQPGLENGLEFRVTYENTRPGGRLRALLPAGTEGDSLWADSHFLLAQHRPPENFEPQRPYPGEKQYDTFNQHEFAFTENGEIRTWIANRGNPEIALVKRNNQSWFALTLHRSVEMLSVTGGGIRQCGAGPAIPVPGARCLRNFEHAFAWGTGKLSKSEVVRLATAFANPVYNQELPYLPQAPETGPVPRFHSFFELDDAMVRISACRPWHSHGLATRVYNMSDQVRKIRLKTGFSGQTWCLADLDEKWNAATEKPLENGCIVFAINPYAIRTVIIK